MMEVLRFTSFAHLGIHLILKNNIISTLLYVCQALFQAPEIERASTQTSLTTRPSLFSASLQQARATDKERNRFADLQPRSLLLLLHLTYVDIHINSSLLEVPEDSAGFACSRIFPI